MTNSSKNSTENRRLRLRRKDIEPPLGWVYVDPDTEFEIRAGHFDSLLERVTHHRAANELEVPIDLPSLVEHWIAQRSPQNFVVQQLSEEDVSLRPLTLTVVKHATQYMIDKYRSTGRVIVSKQTAHKRAATCLQCPMNSSAAACTSCRGLVGWVKGFTRTTTPHDNKLFVCQVSAVMNISHIHFSPEAVKAATPENMVEKHPDGCWKRKLLGNSNA